MFGIFAALAEFEHALIVVSMRPMRNERRRLTAVLADEREWWPWARRVGAAGVVWVVAHGAWAHDGNELLKHCLEPIETAESSYCLGYISAAADILDDDICVPKEVNRGQMNDIAVRYLQAHPELRQRSGVDLAQEALKEAFPCKR